MNRTLKISAEEALLLVRSLDRQREWIKENGLENGWQASVMAVSMAQCTMLADKIMNTPFDPKVS